MAKSEITSISTKLHDLLEPLDPALRKRAIRAALMMLGDEDLEPDPIKKKGKNDEGGDTPQVGGKATRQAA